MTSRRILLLTGNYVNVVDGVALTLNRLVRFLVDRGDEVLVLAPGAKQFALEPAGRFVAVPSAPFALQPEYRVALGLYGRARRRVDAFSPDLVHVATPDILGWAGVRYARRHGLPVVGSFHSNLASYMRFAWFTRLLERPVWGQLRRFYDDCDRVYVPTASMEQELREHGFRVETQLWSRGVDLRRFTPDRRSEAWRRAHGIAPDEFAVLFVARLRWEKGLNLLARIFRRLDESHVRYRPVIVGDGVGRDWLRREVPRAVMPGYLDGEELATAYASSDAFLYPSETDTFGNVTLEAMASGLPAICADAPGARSLVRDGKTGWLVSPGDEPGFAARVAELAAKRERQRELGRAALEHAQTFSWSACLTALSDSYDELLRRSPRSVTSRPRTA
ncbi:MAG: glycosyltransferase family 1 protein [Myxococcales bacterium FL481]|nr:MAG: glycosyltransferase family 1 protein [Myxococcales bacterium FL481]